MTCPTLTEAEKAVYLRRLAEAEEALHRISIGRGVRVFMDQNGERTEYSSANRNQLIAYINQLRLALGLCPMQGVSAPPAGVFL